MKENFLIIRKNHKDFNDLWNNFIENNKNVGPFYSIFFINQMTQRGKSKTRKKNYTAINKSFCISLKDKVECLVPLILEKNGNENYFSTNLNFNSFYGPIFNLALEKNIKNKLREFAFNEIDNLARLNKVLKSIQAIDPLNYFYEKNYFNHLQHYDYLDASISTSIINLNNSEKEIRSNIRKSYHSLINKGLKNFKFHVMNFKNLNYKLFKKYILLHEKSAGFKTRNIKSFNTQYEAIINNHATLFFAEFNGKLIQSNFFNHCNNYAFYSSSAEDPSFKNNKIQANHSLIYYAITYFKKKGFNYLDIGFQRFNTQIHENVTKKMVNISFFKRGFGGEIIPVYRGVKYYNNNFKKKDLINKIKENI